MMKLFLNFRSSKCFISFICRISSSSFTCFKKLAVWLEASSQYHSAELHLMILFQVLRELLDDHKDVVSYLAQGFKECRKHIKVRRSLLLTTGFGTLSLNKWHWFKVPIIINIVGRRASLGVQSGFISVWGSLTGPIDVSWEPGTVNGWLAPFLNLSIEAQILFSPNFCGTRPLPATVSDRLRALKATIRVTVATLKRRKVFVPFRIR